MHHEEYWTLDVFRLLRVGDCVIFGLPDLGHATALMGVLELCGPSEAVAANGCIGTRPQTEQQVQTCTEQSVRIHRFRMSSVHLRKKKGPTKIWVRYSIFCEGCL